MLRVISKVCTSRTNERTFIWHFPPSLPPSLLKRKCDQPWEYRVADGYAHYPYSSQHSAQTMSSVSRRDASLEHPCADCEMNKGKISNSRKEIRFLLLFLFLHVQKRLAMAGVDLQCRTGASGCYCLFSAFKPIDICDGLIAAVCMHLRSFFLVLFEIAHWLATLYWRFALICKRRSTISWWSRFFFFFFFLWPSIAQRIRSKPPPFHMKVLSFVRDVQTVEMTP